jgi:exopolysaccharide biosynthesis polyprenyl glycosylphosphotransferase
MTESLLPSDVVASTEVVPVAEARRRLRRLRLDEANVVVEVGRAALIWFGLFVIYGSQRPLSHSALVGVTVAAGIWLAMLRSAAMPGRVVLGRAVEASVGTTAGLVVVAAVNSSPLGLHVSFLLLVGSAVAVFCSATAWGWAVDRTVAARRRVLLVGAEGAEALLKDELRVCRQPQFDLVGAIPGPEELARIVEAQRPDIVVLTDEESYGTALERLLDARSEVRVAGVESFFEYAFGRVPIEQIGPAWFMSLFHPRQRMYSRFAKRAFDVVVAVVGLVVTAPLMAVLALVTKLTGGPILYRQTRVGEDGRLFTIYKFRTMTCDAEQDGATLARADDPRATRIGCFLRRTHVDELPQLWNVVKGEMSIVGPRPERPELIETIEEAVPFWNRRLLVKPGITGWAQVCCGYAADCEAMETKLSYDLWYLRHRSLLVDLAVCVMTFFAIIRRPLSP